MNESLLGTVTRVDRTNGVVDASLRSGLNLFSVPYLGFPPWKGLEARFTEVAAGSWICQGLQGDLGGLGPNLCTNGNFEFDTSGWDAKKITEWRFDATTESWVGTAFTTLSLNIDNKFYNTQMQSQPTNSLRLSCPTGTASAHSPSGASGVSVTAGNMYEAFARITHEITVGGAARTAHLILDWWDSGNNLISSTTGADVQVDRDAGAWRCIYVRGQAPVGAIHVSVRVDVLSTTSGELLYLDAVFLTAGTPIASISRDTNLFHSGVASLRIDGVANTTAVFAQYPSPMDEPLSGVPVNPGEMYYVDFWNNGYSGYTIAQWIFADGSSQLDYDGNTITPDSDPDYAPTWVYNGISFLVPDNAVAMHIWILFGNDGAGVDTNIDDFQIRQAFVYAGAAITSINPPQFVSQVGGKQQSPAILSLVPASSSWPSVIANGYVFGRKPHCKIGRTSGTQSLTAGATTTVQLDTCFEVDGMEYNVIVGSALFAITILRTGWYLVNAQMRLASYSGLNGPQEMGLEVWRNWSFNQLITTVCEDKKSTAGAEASMGFNASATLKLYRRESLQLKFWNGHNGAVVLDAGFPERQWLAATYLADL